MAVQEPVSSEPQVAAVQPKKKQFKKKTGGGTSGDNGGVLSVGVWLMLQSLLLRS